VTELRADCSRCAGLCCVVPAFAASSDFAIDKPSLTPCPNLADDFGCSIHTELRDRGFPGCTVYDCFGAGQRVVQELYDGRDWQSTPEIKDAMFAAFEVVERLHELLWYLQDALARQAVAPLRDELEGLRDLVEAACQSPVPDHVVPLQLRADGLLGDVSGLVRRGAGGPDLRGEDLAGQDLRGRGLTGAHLRGAVLIGADLRDLDLGPADLLGADLRAAQVAGADLTEVLFLTQFQVNAARGDTTTRLPDRVTRPSHWR
jgi:hypothetical protein